MRDHKFLGLASLSGDMDSEISRSDPFCQIYLPPTGTHHGTLSTQQVKGNAIYLPPREVFDRCHERYYMLGNPHISTVPWPGGGETAKWRRAESQRCLNLHHGITSRYLRLPFSRHAQDK